MIEFRLYYDDLGKVLFYTTENLPGQYIIVDTLTFIEARNDVRVIDGELLKNYQSLIISKLKPTNSTDDSVSCYKEDISIIVDDDITPYTTHWRLETDVR